MRTTLTLDDDVAILLNQRQSEMSIGFKELINSLLRASLTKKQDLVTATNEKNNYSTPVLHGHKLIAGEMTSVAEMLEFAEGENYR